VLPTSHRHQRCATGFSLVEIMVGMVIGMLGIIVIMQVFSVSEAQKRTTTGGDDAQNNGAIALYGLQRDIQQSGYLTGAYQVIGCDVQLRTLPATVTLTAMAPVTINHAAIPAGDANTDTLLVVYGNGNASPEGDGITAQPGGAGGASYGVQSPNAFNAGDRVIAEPQTRPGPCSGTNKLILDTVVSVASPNVAVTAGTGATIGTVVNGKLFNAGQAPKILAYAIRGGNLTLCDYMVNNCGDAARTGDATFWVPVASNIVSMRAQYGRDTQPVVAAQTSYRVDTYDQTTPTTNCNWVRMAAVRLALVARNGQFNKAAVTTNAPVWAGSAGNAINLTANTSWQNYRYKVFQTTVPLKNMAWMGVQSGC
jgi:type IV pilus assembly protein PilW